MLHNDIMIFFYKPIAVQYSKSAVHYKFCGCNTLQVLREMKKKKKRQYC